jgi:Phytanoyl-CoA dioxygenase (PhyH)
MESTSPPNFDSDDDDVSVAMHTTSRCQDKYNNTSVGTTVLGDDSSSNNSISDDSSIVIENHDDERDVIPKEVVHVQHDLHVRKTNKATSRPYRFIVGLLWLVMIVVFDIIFLIIPFGLHGAATWLRHVHDHYLEKQLDALYVAKRRVNTDFTYYERICDDRTDVTTSNPDDVWLSPEATTEEALDHHLTHGFTGFVNVLSPETITKLRDLIYHKNYNTESLYVIEQNHRYSVLLGTEEPMVAQAMEEIANHPQLSPAIEAVIGPDPALIELTAISSSYGAIDQWWHEDVSYQYSAQNYAYGYGTSYSIFIQLQNTTSTMGLTNACPGTHLCSTGPIANMCQKYGFPATKTHYDVNGTAKSYFHEGDALLMSSDSIHRGAAFTEPNAPDRIMFIVSFSPKPKKRAETRQMTQGLTFQLRWDMWGKKILFVVEEEFSSWNICWLCCCCS